MSGRVGRMDHIEGILCARCYYMARRENLWLHSQFHVQLSFRWHKTEPFPTFADISQYLFLL